MRINSTISIDKTILNTISIIWAKHKIVEVWSQAKGDLALRNFQYNRTVITFAAGMIAGSMVFGGAAFAKTSLWKEIRVLNKYIRVEVNGQTTGRLSAIDVGNVMYVPATSIAAAIGARAQVVGNKTAINIANAPVVIRAGRVVIGGAVSPRSVPIIYNGQAYVRADALSAKLGVQATWSNASKSVSYDLSSVPQVVSSGQVDMVGHPLADVHPILYGGTPYIPAATIAQELQIPNNWTAGAGIDYFGDQTSSGALTTLLQPTSVSGFGSNGSQPMINSSMKMNGASFSNGLQFIGGSASSFSANPQETITYNLNGNYAKLTGLLGMDDNSISANGVDISIVGDGNTLYHWTMGSGQAPEQFSVNVKGVQKLQFVLNTYGLYDSQTNTSENVTLDFANLTLS